MEKIKSFFFIKNEKINSLTKLVLKIFLWCLVSIFAIALLLLIFIEPILKFSVTTIGSKVTGSNITLDSVELSLSRGIFKIVNLKVGNPENFDSPGMLELGTFFTSWDNKSLLTKKIIIHDIEVRQLHVTAEVNESGKLNFLALAEKFAPKDAGKTADPEVKKAGPSTPPPEIWIEKFVLEDFDFNWIDRRKEFSIHGFGASFEKIDGSITGGNIIIKNLQVDNPESYKLDNLLEIIDINIQLDPQTLYSQTPVIKNIEVSGLTACAEFNNNGEFNVLALVDSLQNIFPEKTPADPQPETDNAENDESGNAPQPQAELKSFSLTGSWFHLEDDRMQIPVKVPLMYAISDFQFFDDNNIDILPFLHKQAVMLQETCSGVTNADQLTINFVKTAAQSGARIFKSAGNILLGGAEDAGKTLINSAADAGNILIDSGNKLINGDKKSGKKVLNKLFDAFR